MTPSPTDYRKQKQIALTSLVGASLVLGVVNAALHLEPSSGWTLIGNVLMLILGFRWLALDSAELDIRRPVWLNVGIVLAAIVFVPYYLYKTRPAGRRGPAILGFFSLLLACMFAVAVGAMLMAYFSGEPPATPA